MQRQPLRSLLICWLATQCACCGCSDESEEISNSGDKTVVEKTVATKTNAKTDNKSVPSTPRLKPAKSAAAAVQQFVDEIAAGRADVVWDSLPPRYRSDINGLVRDLANKVDAEVWRKSLETWLRLVVVLGDKQDLLAKSGMLAKSPIKAGDVQRIAPHLVAMFETLLGSDLKETDRLAEFDGRRFLSTTGSQLIGHLKLATKGLLPSVTWEQYLKDAVLISALQVDGDSALVEVLLRGSQLPPINLEMRRVDDYWIPASLASGWSTAIGTARKGLEKMPPVTDKTRELQMQSIGGVNVLLDGLAKVETVDEFSTAAAKLLAGFFPSEFSSTPNTTPPVEKPKPSTTDGTISIVVTQLLDEAATNELVAQWERLSDSADVCEVDTFTKDGHTVFVVTPVSDLKKFAESIDFVDSVDLDPKQKAIRITLPKPGKKP